MRAMPPCASAQYQPTYPTIDVRAARNSDRAPRAPPACGKPSAITRPDAERREDDRAERDAPVGRRGARARRVATSIAPAT